MKTPHYNKLESKLNARRRSMHKVFKRSLKLICVLFVILFIHEKIIAQGWQAAGAGTNNQTTCLKVYDGKLYAGGLFTIAGGNTARRIAVWDGSTWDSLGSGLNSNSFRMEVYNNELYVAGSFLFAGGISTNRVARWNGAAWDSVGGGMNGIVIPLRTYNGELYAGGNFSMAGGVPVLDGYARWNGANWASLPLGGDGGGDGEMEVFNGLLYAGGADVKTWNGTSWGATGSGVSGGLVVAMAVYNNELYVGGTILMAGGLPVNRIAKWNGSQWSDVGGGITGGGPALKIIHSLKVYNGELYAGGQFDSAGGVPAANIAKWNGSTWSPVCSGVNNRVRALEEYNGELYVSGEFTIAGGIAASRVARWLPPLAVVLPVTASVCNNSSVTLTANSGNYIYQWYNNNVLMPGETSNELMVSAPGSYSVVTSVNGQPCAGTASSTPMQVTEGTGPTNVTITSSPTVGCQPNTIYTGYGAQSITLTANATGAVSYLWSTGATTQSISVTTAGAYSVTAFDASGCASAPTPETQIVINVADARCGNNKEKILLCHVPHGNSANAQTICIAPTAVAAHLALHAGDCIGDCVSSTRETITEEEESEIIIEPNPAKEQFTIYDVRFTIERVEVLDVLGKRVIDLPLNPLKGTSASIEVSWLAPGIYFVKVRGEGFSVSKKVVKM